MYQLWGSADLRPHFLVLGLSSWRHYPRSLCLLSSEPILGAPWTFFHQSQGYREVLSQFCWGPDFLGTTDITTQKSCQPGENMVMDFLLSLGKNCICIFFFSSFFFFFLARNNNISTQYIFKSLSYYDKSQPCWVGEAVVLLKLWLQNKLFYETW